MPISIPTEHPLRLDLHLLHHVRGQVGTVGVEVLKHPLDGPLHEFVHVRLLDVAGLNGGEDVPEDLQFFVYDVRLGHVAVRGDVSGDEPQDKHEDDGRGAPPFPPLHEPPP
jgi:hypothetical protein